MPESINSKLKEQYDHDDSGGSLDTNLGDFLDSEGASGTSNNSKWRDWASGTGTSLNTRLFHKHGGSGSFMTRWKNWIAFSSTHSFNFDGSNDYLDCGTSLGNQLGDNYTGTLTISMWVKYDPSVETSGGLFYIGNFNGGYGEVNIYAGSNNRIIFHINDAFSSRYTFALTDTSTDWKHIAFVIDASVEANNKVYLNGVDQELTSGQSPTFPLDFDFSNLKTLIGAYYNSNLTFDGLIDEVAIWDTALSASDVSSIYNNGKVIDLSKSASYGVDRTGNLKLWLRCGDKAEPESTTAIARQDFYTDFDGTDDYVIVADNDDLSFGDGSSDTPFSISVWANLPTIGSTYFISKGHFGSNYEYLFHIGSDKKFYWILFDQSSGGYIGRIYNTALDAYENQWTHFCGTYDGSGANSGVKLYINGVQVDDTNGGVGSYTAMENLGAEVRIMRHNTNYSDGSISNLAVYKAELDAQTISQMAKSRFTPMRDNRFSVVDFDGSDDYIAVPDNDSLDVGTSDFTLSAWVNLSDASENYIFSKGDGTNHYSLRLNGNRRISYEFNVSGQSNKTPTDDGTQLTLGQWHHIACVFDRNGNSFRYVDGINTGTNDSISSHSASISTSDALNIGRKYSGHHYFDGSIASASIYIGTAKSAEEIYAIYQQGITYDESSLSGLVGYWRMGDDTSKAYPTIADSSSNSNDGTITNGASDDIVQQMVAGYDLGAFESSSEELSAESAQDNTFANTTNSQFWNGQSSISNNKLHILGSNHGGSQSGNCFIDQSSANNAQISSNPLISGKLYKVTGTVTVNSLNGGEYIRSAFDASFTRFFPSLSVGTESFTIYIVANKAYIDIQIPNCGADTNITLDAFSVKEVLQSEVSDTFPFITDVNEPVLGAELVTSNTTSNWTAMGSGTSKANITNGVTLTAGTDARNHFYTVSGTSSNKIYKFNVDAFIDDGSDTNAKINVYDGSASNLLDALTTTTQNFTFYFIHNGTPFIQFDGFDNGTTVNIQNMSIKEIQGNVGTMTNQDSADLVYSSVLPDQSFLTGVNSAYNFISLDGANDYVNTGSPFQSTFRDSFSVSAWIKPTDGIPSAESAIFAVRGSGGRFYIRVLSDGRFSSYIHDGTSSKATLPNSVTFSDGQEDWHHVCAVINNSTNLVLLYVDGVEQALQSGTYSGDISSLTLSNFTSTDNIYIGARNNQGSADRFFNGDIGQIALWSKALSSTEVSAIYTAGRYSNLLNSYSDNLKAYYAFGALDAVTGLSDTTTTIYDRSGNSNHGTPVSIASADLKSPPNAEPNGYAKGDTNRSTTTP